MADKVKISDSTSTTSSVIAASCTAVKTAYDLAAEAAGRDVGVTSFNGSKGDVTYTAPVTSVNGITGAVTISTTPSTVYGIIGSAVAANTTSITLPSGGTWFVFNPYGLGTDSYGAYGVSTSSATNSTGYTGSGTTFSGGTTVYAKQRWDNGDKIAYSLGGKLVAVRIS